MIIILLIFFVININPSLGFVDFHLFLYHPVELLCPVISNYNDNYIRKKIIERINNKIHFIK